MKTLALILASATALLNTPAVAQTISPRVEATTSTNNISTGKIVYGLGTGFDANLRNRLTVGVEASAENLLDGNDPTLLYGGLRLGYRLSPSTLLYGSGGYATSDGNGGYRVGLGVQQNLIKNLYVRLGATRTDLGSDAANAGTFALGLRF